MKGLLVVSADSGEVTLFPTAGVEEGMLPTGKAMESGHNGTLQGENTVADIKLLAGTFFAVRGRGTVDVYEVNIPLQVKGGSFFDNFNFKFPVYLPARAIG